LAAHSFRLFALVCSLIAARVTCTRHRKFPKLSQQVREPKIEKRSATTKALGHWAEIREVKVFPLSLEQILKV